VASLDRVEKFLQRVAIGLDPQRTYGLPASIGGGTASQEQRRQPHAHIRMVGIECQGTRVCRLGITVPSCEFVGVPEIREQLDIVGDHGAAALQFEQRVVVVCGGTIGELHAILDQRRIRTVADANRQCEAEDRQDNDGGGDSTNWRERPVQNVAIIARTAESV
jgi:hypothetical protein